MVPILLSQSARVKGILSPSSSMRIIINWPALAFCAISGEKIIACLTCGAISLIDIILCSLLLFSMLWFSVFAVCIFFPPSPYAKKLISLWLYMPNNFYVIYSAVVINHLQFFKLAFFLIGFFTRAFVLYLYFFNFRF